MAVRPGVAPHCVEGTDFELGAVRRVAAPFALVPRHELSWEITCFMFKKSLLISLVRTNFTPSSIYFHCVYLQNKQKPMNYVETLASFEAGSSSARRRTDADCPKGRSSAAGFSLASSSLVKFFYVQVILVVAIKNKMSIHCSCMAPHWHSCVDVGM